MQSLTNSVKSFGPLVLSNAVAIGLSDYFSIADQLVKMAPNSGLLQEAAYVSTIQTVKIVTDRVANELFRKLGTSVKLDGFFTETWLESIVYTSVSEYLLDSFTGLYDWLVEFSNGSYLMDVAVETVYFSVAMYLGMILREFIKKLMPGAANLLKY